MPRPVIVLISLLVLLGAVPASADDTLTVVADSTLAGNDGFLLHGVSSDGGQSIFVFEEDGKLRVYAIRNFGESTWGILPSAQYLVPTQTLQVGDKWDYLQNESGDPMEAECNDLVGITVPAGFFSVYLVDIVNLNDPEYIVETIFFAEGVGFVRDQGYQPGGALDWQEDLSSYSIAGGSGFMPMAVGNTWNFVDISVLAAQKSFGGLKAGY